MSKGVIKAIGVVAGVVAVVATAGAALFPGLAVAGVTASTIAGVAGLVSAAASLGTQLLAKPPPARGSVANVIIAVDPLQPYAMGRGLVGGVRRYDNGYGATLKKVPNPYLWLVDVLTGGGPVASVTPYVDKAPISSWFTGFLFTSVALGACPAAALTPHFAGAPGWDSSSKLSGQAAVGFNALFDKDGKRFASGFGNNTGAYGDWVLAYDPRQDTTFPGGSGPHRLGDETTYEWTENPALHAATYAFGRYQNGKRTIGAGFPAESIDWSNVASWANLCEANDWSIFGCVYEPGNRWPNLQEIAAAGGARPIVTAGKLSFVYNAPRVAVATITEADLAADPVEVTAQAAYGDRFTSVIPKWTSPSHEWQQIAGAPLTIGDFVTEEGEDRVREWPFNLVKSDDGRQPGELALYKLWDAHELQPIVVPCKHHMRHWNAGDCFELNLPDKGLTTDVIAVQKQFDPVTLQPVFICLGETSEKHAFILGQTSTPPPTPALGQTAQERDELAAAAVTPPGFDTSLISTSYVTDADPLDGLLQATDTTITVETHTRTYADKSVSVTGGSLTLDDTGAALVASTGSVESWYHVYYDDPARAGGAVTLKATTDSVSAATSDTNPDRHYVGSIPMDVVGGTGSSGGGATPPGWRDNVYLGEN